ncbi:Transposon Tf2-8 polyprotein [Vitis vinifera]|uniref:Transposon Tf2-8 polyprotein n=1 Tax=Vitis vinifera TaxID=29760 RepID=A0A438ERH1_VITVI|nr:Transposon Tf2-8 polyprotein [Vitis vinifera]
MSTRHLSRSEITKDVIAVDSLFDGLVGLGEGASDFVDPPLSFDVLSRFVSRHDDVYDYFDIDDEIVQHDLDDDSSSVSDLDPMDQSVSPATGDTELVDFSTVDQPRELRIRSDLSTDERDSLIQDHTWTFSHGPMRTCRALIHLLSNIICHFCPMPDRLKNTRATYQRTATTLFHDMMHQDVEVYVDNMIVKSQDKSDHLAAALERKLLRYMVSERGIEVDSDKIRAILDMLALRTKRGVRGFLGRLQYINRFIARLIDISEPIFKLLRKNQLTVWDDQCQRAFERIREYLLSPSVLAPPTPGRHLVLYLLVSDVALGCMLAQLDDSSKKRAIYYLSKRMLDYETRYVMIERYCLALNSIRGSIVVDHLASLPIFDGRAIDDDFPNEDVATVTSLSGWCMYFDGAAKHFGYGIGVLLISPHGDHILRYVRLAFSDRHPAMNNIVEYEACILGLETAFELEIRQMEVFGDFNMVLRQIQGKWKTKDMKLRPYHAYLELLVRRFDDLRYTHLPRAQNQFADALATLAL